MTGKAFYNGVANDKDDILALFLSVLEETGASYCIIGGLAVNAYVEPLVSLDLDVVVALSNVEVMLSRLVDLGLQVTPFVHSLNLAAPGSDVRIQIQTDARYQDFLSRAEERDVLGYAMRVASIEDVLQGKLWAHADTTRRPSKRQKDLADILRMVESHPSLSDRLPQSLRNLSE